jgi:hypothetical protein
MSVPLLHSKTCLLAVLYVPLVIMVRRFLQMPLRPESHLYDMATFRPGGLLSVGSDFREWRRLVEMIDEH